ncbi:MAG: ArgE/DapE family deacylase [Actinomycetales bacterium]|nr:ArgE/DapE family deacylase [Actinomycetales bacterium]
MTSVPDIDSARLIEDLSALLAIPSVSGTPAEVEAQDWLAERWSAEGFEVDRWDIDLDRLTADPEFPGMEVDRDHAVGVTATLKGDGNGPTLLLDGHTDVVPPGDLDAWSGDPFVPRRMSRNGADVLVARGASDMKAGVAAMWAATRAIAEAGITLRGDVILAPVSGEEDGGLGTFALLRHGVTAAMCIVPEPTSLGMVPGNGGALTFRLTVPGLAAHASMRMSGVSAIERFIPLYHALEELEARRNRDVDPIMERWPIAYPLSIGTVHAGDWASTVPDVLVAEGRLGVAIGEEVEDARAELEATVAATCAADPWLRDHPARVTWWGGQFASGRVDPKHPISSIVAEVHEEVSGQPLDVYGGPYGSDLRLLTRIGGIPTVHYGPGTPEAAHTPDEYVRVDEVIQSAQALARLILRICG